MTSLLTIETKNAPIGPIVGVYQHNFFGFLQIVYVAIKCKMKVLVYTISKKFSLSISILDYVVYNNKENLENTLL